MTCLFDGEGPLWLMPAIANPNHTRIHPKSQILHQHDHAIIHNGDGLFIIVITPCLKKMCKCYFLNNSVKHWPI